MADNLDSFFDQINNDQTDSLKSQVKGAMFVAQDSSPDEAAESVKLAKQYNVTPDFAKRNLETLKKQSQGFQVDEQLDSIVNQNPKLASWISDPTKAEFSKDDLDNLKNTENVSNDHSTVDKIYNATAAGFANLNSSFAKLPYLAYDLAVTPTNILAEAGGYQQLSSKDSFLGPNVLGKYFDEASQSYTNKVPEINLSVSQELKKGNIANASKALAYQFITNAPQQAMTIAMALSGYGAAGLATTGALTAASKNEEAQNSGVSPLAATGDAALVGTIESAFESIGTFGILHHWEEALAKDFGKQTSKEVIKSLGKTLGYSFAAEGNEEAMTSVAQDLSDYVSGVNPDALQGIGQRALDAGLVGGFSGGVMTAPSGAAAAYYHNRTIKQAQLSRDTYLAMGNDALASKVRERLPEAHRDFVSQVTKDGPINDIYIPVEALETYYQSKNIPLIDGVNELGLKEQYDKAKETGADIKVSMADWVDKVVATEAYTGLQDDIKFSPDGESVKTARKAKEDLGNEIKSVTEQVDKEEKEGKLIQDDVYRQLVEAGTDKSEAKKQAIVYRSIKVLADREGISPASLYKQYGLKIISATENVGGDIDKQIYNQSATNNDAFTQTQFGYPGQVDVVHDFGKVFASTEDIKNTIINSNAGKVVTNKHTGIPIETRVRGLELSSRYLASEANKRALLNLPKLIENAVYARKEGDSKSHQGNHIFYAPLSTAGKDYVMKITVREENGVYFTNAIGVEKEHLGRLRQQSSATQAFISTDKTSIAQLMSDVAETRKKPGFTLFQSDSNKMGQENQGQIAFDKNRQAVISLFKSKDQSTFLHESGHLFLEIMGDLAERPEASEGLKNDYAGVLKYLGVNSRSEIKTEQHEKWARSFEAYLLEGKSPSSELRKAFNSFKLWLTRIYKDVSGLSKQAGQEIKINDEVRGIMDRLLASEEEIKSAEVEVGIKPLFENPKAYGLSDKQAADYMTAMEESRLYAEAKLNQKLLDDLKKQQTKAYKEKVNKYTSDFKEELKSNPIYNVINVLTKGQNLNGNDVQKLKLDKKAVVEMLGQDVADSLPKNYFNQKEGLHPDIIAQAFGIENGVQLINELTKSTSIEQESKRLANEKIQTEEPDLLKSPDLSEEAKAALHNDKRADLLRFELKYLLDEQQTVFKDAIKRTVRRMPTREAVKQQANKIVADIKTSELKPHLYLRAEVKASKEAGIALAKGDLKAAVEAKQKEYLNHEIYRAITDAKEDVEKTVKKFKKQFAKSNEDVSKKRDADLINTARAVLSQFGIGRVDYDPQEYLNKVKAYDPQQFEVLNNILETALEGAGPYEEVSYNDFSEMKMTVDAMYDLAKSSKEIEIEGKKVDIAVAIDELNAQSAVMSSDKEKPKYDKEASQWDKFKVTALAARAAMTRVEAWSHAMDLGEFGAFTKTIFKPISDATVKYRLEKNNVITQYKDILTKYKDLFSDKAIVSDEINFEFKNKASLLMSLLHTGNESNKSKLLRGRGWGLVDENGNLDSTNFDAMIERFQKDGTLTKRDYQFAQDIWNLMESLKPAAQRAHKSMYGFYFNEITAKEITTPFGSFSGGYIPAKVDVYANEDASIRQEREEFEKNNNSFQFPTTGRGFTKSRVESYAAPLSLDINLLGSHIDGTLRFIHIEPKVKQVSRVVLDKSFREAIKEVDPTIASEALIPWLQRSAQQKVVIPSTNGIGKLTDKAARYLRTSVAMQFMVGNVTNAAQQFTGIVVAASKVKPKHLRNSLVEYISNREEMVQGMIEKSDFMNTTQGSNVYEAQQAINEIVTNPSTFQSIRDFSIKHTYFLQSTTQNIVNSVVWNAAYNQAAEKGLNEKQSIFEADQAVRLTQGSMSPEDVSRFETGTATYRLFTQFSGYFNMLANLNASEIVKINKQLGLKKGASKYFYLYAMSFMLPAVLSGAIVKAMAGDIGSGDDDDDSYLNNMLQVFFGSQFSTGSAMVPFIGPLAASVVNRFNGVPYDDRLTFSPVLSVLETTAGLPAEIYKGLTKDEINTRKLAKDALTMVGTLAAIPAGPVGKPVGYLIDVNEGKANPSGPIDFARGLISGQRGK